jgi:transposase
LLCELVAGKPAITLAELQAELQGRGIIVKALSTIHDMLHRLGLRHKKRA